MALTSWDNVVNSFVHNTSDVYASRDGVTGGVAQGGAFASSEIAQTVAVPAGYEYGELRVECARGNDADVLADDTGEVVIEALADDGDVAEIDVAPLTTGSWDSIFEARDPGTEGNSITFRARLDTTPSVTEVGTAVTVAFVDGVTTVADIEALVNSDSTLVQLKTAGSVPAYALTLGADVFAATNLTGGDSNTGTVLATATTGAEFFSPRAEFTRRRLSLALPDDTAYVRTRLVANRSLGSGNSGALFADFSMRIFKDLDPAYVWDFDFGTPALQALPSSYQLYHLDYPDHPVPIVWGGTNEEPSAIASGTDEDATHAWSDDPLAHTAGKFVAHLAASGTNATPQTVISTDCYRFNRAIAAAAIDLHATSASYGNFTSAASFSIAVAFRVRELALATACGLVGRRNASGVGWGLGITAAGLATFTIQGASGAAVATGTVDVSDRAPRWVIATYDAATDTLTLHDGGVAQTDATATGEFETAEDIPMRIGRDGPASATGDVDIARVYLYSSVLTAAEASELMTFGGNPTDETAMTWSSSHPVFVAGPDDDGGATLVRYAADQVPIAYSATLDADGDDYGVALASAKANFVPSNDLANAAWTVSGATRTTGTVDPTGMPLGAEIEVATAGTDYLQLETTAPGSAGTLRGVFWLRTTDAGPYDMDIEIRADDGSATLKDTLAIVVTSSWQRFELETALWDDAVNTALLRFVLDAAAGAGATFEIAHVAWVGLDEDYPLAVQDAAQTLTATSGLLLEALPRQLNHEGEIYAEGVCSMASPVVGVRIAAVDNDSDDVNRRELTISTGAVPALSLHDASGVEDETLGVANADWTAAWTARGRWNALDLPETTGNTVGVVSGDGETYDAVAFTIAAAAGAAIRIGGGPDAVLRRVRVTSREPKLT